MNILIACEESQTICIEMRAVGNVCYSADLQECSGGHPEWHIIGDCIPLLNGYCEFKTQDGESHKLNSKWDLIIAHPPCTYLTISGNRWFNVEKYGENAIQRKEKREEAVEFFMKFVDADCDHIAIENPIGIMGHRYKPQSQIIQPYFFGDEARKTTCLWLKNLPLLKPTKIVSYGEIIGDGYSIGASSWYATENGKIISWNDPRTAKIRSKTFIGIAKAIAAQWGKEEILKYKDPLPRKFW